MAEFITDKIEVTDIIFLSGYESIVWWEAEIVVFQLIMPL